MCHAGYCSDSDATVFMIRVLSVHSQRHSCHWVASHPDNSDQWQQERRKRLTASVVGGIAKMKKKTKKSKKVQALLYSTFRGNQATRYGRSMEAVSIHQYVSHQQATRYGRSMEAVSIHQYVSHHQKQDPNFRVDKCELFISKTNNWLAASPDGIVHDSSNTAD